MAATQKNRRTWETAFLLTASLDSGFKGAFEEAEQVMKDLRKEYDAESTTLAERTADAFDAAASAVVASGVIDLLGGIAQGYKACIEAAADFEYTMSGVEAVALADAESMALLEEQAKELGATTKFTAVQSAEAMTYMAQAGWSTQEMLAGMPGVINLAAASGEDLAQSSSILADTLAGFQLEAAESARVADVLAQAAAASNTSVLEMGDTFKTSAALAGALGYSIEDVSAAVGLMANVGIKGSRAGTTLRNILGGFLGGVTIKGTAIGEVDWSAVNEDGSMQSFADSIKELRVLFSQMTEAEKISNARNIAGERGYTGLIGILEATDEAYNEMYQSIQNAEGAAQRMAEIRLDNLTGDVTILKSALEGLEIAIGEQFSDELRGVVQIGTSGVNLLADFVEHSPGAVESLASLTAGLTAAAGAISLVAVGAKAFAVLGGLSMFTNPAVLATGAIVGLTAAIGTAILTEDIYNDSLWETIDAHYALEKEMSASLESLDAEAYQVRALYERFETLAENEYKTVAEKQELLALTMALNDAVPGLALVYDAETDSINMSTQALENYIEAMITAEREKERMAQYQTLLEEVPELQSNLKNAIAERDRWQATVDEYQSMNWFERYLHWDEMGIAMQNLETAEELVRESQAAYAQNIWGRQNIAEEYGASPAVEAEQSADGSETVYNITVVENPNLEAQRKLLEEAGIKNADEIVDRIAETIISGGRTGY